MQGVTGVRPEIIDRLQPMLLQVQPFVTASPDASLVLQPGVLDRRRYNFPVDGEMAVLMVGSGEYISLLRHHCTLK